MSDSGGVDEDIAPLGVSWTPEPGIPSADG